ncbi:glycoside hydrolase family 66 protein [[Bacillus] enclensis]|uniref:glycoside hydrolase family 66 protein n=1 Tax=[Bacillus] enclensis TaxID=1402860 RepID=UPI0022B61FFC|nr:glycoside hydrolase family 66 protein [[Bacillus] enclensis]
MLFYFLLGYKDDSGSVPSDKRSIISSLTTDKARYHPGEEVWFSCMTNASSGTITVTYYHLNKKIGKESIPIHEKGMQNWRWAPPSTDYKGYLAVVEFTGGENHDRAAIGVDISSDWSKFPRYGFLTHFDVTDEVKMRETLAQLNRFHLNGLQFYDWHYEHQEPLKMIKGKPAEEWEDVSNRKIKLDSINQYIKLSHERNMMAMGYNLLYGSFENRNDVSREWHLFKDPDEGEIDQHPLPSGWKSSINIMNPTNPWWQEFLIDQQKAVYRNLDFDGWHIDQLGNRGNVYNELGDSIDLSESFLPFLTKIKEEISEKAIVMNAVNQYGQESISASPVPFLYTEVWDPHNTYKDLQKLLYENHSISQGTKNTVLAAYMNYDHSEETGQFNESGVLLTNAVIFANGGAHLELGEHMLSREYFPHDSLTISPSLRKKLIHYYDFLTAYENVLRDGIVKSEAELQTESGLPLSSNGEKGTLWYTARQKENSQILHFINLIDTDHTKWRDNDGSQPKASKRKEIDLSLSTDREIKKLWLASPDIRGGEPITLPYNHNGHTLSFELPSIEYWDMVVIEFK